MAGFFLTLKILCAAFRAANTNGLELAQKLEPASLLPGLMPGPEWALGVSSLTDWVWAEGVRETFMRKDGLGKLLEKSPLGNAGDRWL